MANSKAITDVEVYFSHLRLVRTSGGANDEKSLCVPLANLLNAVGGALGPTVFCVQELADQGVGHPDFGLYTTQQVQKGEPKSGQKPERGVVEVKPVDRQLSETLLFVAASAHSAPSGWFPNCGQSSRDSSVGTCSQLII